jgi:hypothetical protein
VSNTHREYSIHQFLQKSNRKLAMANKLVK